ncbi:hypothetical protein [Oceanithermus profundus]
MTARQAAALAAFARLARHPALRDVRPVLAGTVPFRWGWTWRRATST